MVREFSVGLLNYQRFFTQAVAGIAECDWQEVGGVELRVSSLDEDYGAALTFCFHRLIEKAMRSVVTEHLLNDEMPWIIFKDNQGLVLMTWDGCAGWITLTKTYCSKESDIGLRFRRLADIMTEQLLKESRESNVNSNSERVIDNNGLDRIIQCAIAQFDSECKEEQERADSGNNNASNANDNVNNNNNNLNDNWSGGIDKSTQDNLWRYDNALDDNRSNDNAKEEEVRAKKRGRDDDERDIVIIDEGNIADISDFLYFQDVDGSGNSQAVLDREYDKDGGGDDDRQKRRKGNDGEAIAERDGKATDRESRNCNDGNGESGSHLKRLMDARKIADNSEARNIF